MVGARADGRRARGGESARRRDRLRADPGFEAADERAVYAAAHELSHTGRLSKAVYDAAQQFLGDPGMVELVATCGYYTLISFLLNAFDVPPVPAGLGRARLG